MDKRFTLKKFNEPVGNDSMSDANVAEQVETPVVVETPPQL